MARKKKDNGIQLTFEDVFGSLDGSVQTEPDSGNNEASEEHKEVAGETIQDVEYSELMQQSYIDYAMSVITDRAVPDIRDGLKPVQRRILYDMAELGISSTKEYKKCARIVGDTMGKYHPHGDSSIEGALVVMAQDFKYGTPLVDGHGNFGSIEGDGAAAARYIEAKLQPFTEIAMLSDLKTGAVNYHANYDGNEKEPDVLPCKIPNFLVNGSEGIAVGMATNTPPHNLGETLDTAIYFLDHPDATSEKLLEYLHGPDFPTGGIVSNQDELAEIYKTGTGKIKIRGKIQFEKGTKGQKDKLVITEIPYTMIGSGIAKFLQSVADLVENRTLTDITDITNQTSKKGIRIVLELKKNADVDYITSVLYKKTRLEDTFGVNMLAITHQRPEVMSLSRIMQEYTAFQYELYTKKYTALLEKLEKQIEINEGLVIATDVIDTIIEVMRGSKNTQMARDCLMAGKTDDVSFRTKRAEKEAKSFAFTEAQANSILEMRLSRLIGLELDQLKKELESQEKEAARYRTILENSNEMKKEIKKVLVNIKKQFAVPRKTEILNAQPIVIQEKEEEEKPVIVLIDRFGYVHVVDKPVYERNKDSANAEYKYIQEVSNKGKLLVFTDTGTVHNIKISAIPFGKMKDKGQPIDNLCGYDGTKENIVGISVLNNNDSDADRKLLFVSSDGFVKLVQIQEFDVTRRTTAATKLNENQTLFYVTEYKKNSVLLLLASDNNILKIQVDPIPEKKKNAVGVAGIKCNKKASLVSVESFSDEDDIVTFARKNISLNAIKAGRRGTKGSPFVCIESE